MTIRFGLLLAGLALLLPGAARAGWLQVKSQHFILYGEGDEKSLRNFAQDLEKFDFLLRTIIDIKGPDTGRPVEVYLLSNQSKVAALAGNPNILGFLTTSDREDYAVLSHEDGSDIFDKSTEATLFHEYTHHFMMYYLPSVYPVWYVEGFAEFFETAKFPPDGGIEFGLAPPERKPGLIQDTNYSLKQIFDRNPWNLNQQDGDRYYGVAWLLTHYFEYTPARQVELKAYLADLAKGVANPDPNHYFAGGLAGLEKDLHSYAQHPLNRTRLTGASVTIGPITVTPLDPVRGMLIEEQLQLMGHIKDEDVPDLVRSVSKVAARYPDSGWAATMLAEAEWRAKDKTAAFAAIERATVLDPALSLAWSDRAEMLLDKAKTSHSPEDWAAARAAIVKANRVNTEDPVPLALFFDYFTLKGDPIPQSAYNGLAKAFMLLPQNPNYRIRYAEAMAHRGDYAQASQLLDPLAYSPHDSGMRKEALRLKAEFDAAAAKRGGATAVPVTPLPVEAAP